MEVIVNRQAKEAREAMGAMTRELAALSQMTVAQLSEKYEEVFGESARSRNKAWLRKKVAWRIQELTEGGLSDRAKARIDELNEADSLTWPRPRRPKSTTTAAVDRDPRLPSAGTVLVRTFKGVEHQVTVLQTGFEFRGQHYASLSKIAGEITGTHWNGFLFFRLQRRTRKKQEATG